MPGFAPSCVVSDCECSQYTDQDSVTPEASKQPATFAPAREAILALAGPEPSADAPEFSEPPAESAPTVIPVDELLRRGHESELKPIARLAERIDTLLEDLRDRLADEAAATGVKDLISDLEQQLADAKAKLRGVATGRRTTITAAVDPASVDGSFHCPECPKTFSSAQGVTMHRTRSHGYRKAAT